MVMILPLCSSCVTRRAADLLTVPRRAVVRTPRSGVGYAGAWADRPLRFVVDPALLSPRTDPPSTILRASGRPLPSGRGPRRCLLLIGRLPLMHAGDECFQWLARRGRRRVALDLHIARVGCRGLGGQVREPGRRWSRRRGDHQRWRGRRSGHGLRDEEVDVSHGLRLHAALPPRYAFGFFACRWGWVDQPYIESVLAEFRSGAFPIDSFISDFEWCDPPLLFLLPARTNRILVWNCPSLSAGTRPLPTTPCPTAAAPPS
jgi:hypothetical protein